MKNILVTLSGLAVILFMLGLSLYFLQQEGVLNIEPVKTFYQSIIDKINNL